MMMLMSMALSWLSDCKRKLPFSAGEYDPIGTASMQLVVCADVYLRKPGTKNAAGGENMQVTTTLRPNIPITPRKTLRGRCEVNGASDHWGDTFACSMLLGKPGVNVQLGGHHDTSSTSCTVEAATPQRRRVSVSVPTYLNGI